MNTLSKPQQKRLSKTAKRMLQLIKMGAPATILENEAALMVKICTPALPPIDSVRNN